MPADAPAAFFSYSREDSEFALRLAEDLRTAGAAVWIDQLDIDPGQRWDRAVERALKSCPRTLVILSPASVESDNVRDEISFALRNQKTIIPVLYLDCDIPLRLERHQHIDFRTDHARGLKALLRSLGVDQPQQLVAPGPPAAVAKARPSDEFADKSKKLERERLAAAETARLEEESRPAAEQTRLGREGKKAARLARPKQERPVRKKAVREGGGDAPVFSDEPFKLRVLRELRILAGHTAEVYGVALSGHGRRAVSASWDKTLKVWAVASGRALRTLTGHADGVTAVAVTPDGQAAVSGSRDETLKVWEVASGRELHTLEGHTSWVNGVALSGDGRLAVSASMDNTLRVWDVESGRAQRILKGHSRPVNGVCLSENGRLAVSASQDKTLKVWEVASGRALRTLTGHTAGVWGVALGGDGRLAVSASYDHTLKVWELASGRELRTLDGHRDVVWGVALSRDGRRAVSASRDKTLKVWHLASGRELASFKSDAALFCCALSPDGKTILAGGGNGVIHVLSLE